MAITIRTLSEEDDLRAALTPVQYSFGNTVKDDDLEDAADFIERSRFFSARDSDDVPVGSAATLTWNLAVPGGSVRTGAVTEVGVLSTHRRQGVASQLMAAQLDDALRRGEPLTTLYASEATIYGRFGYGPSSSTLSTRLDTRHAAFSDPPTPPGSIHVVTIADARDEVCSVFDRYWAGHPGEHSRTDGYWNIVFRDRETHRRGGSALQALVHRTDGVADGYLLFRTKDDWSDALPNGTIIVVETVAADTEIELALLHHVMERDLFPFVEMNRRPVDDPLKWRLTDGRRVKRGSDDDAIWVRILDVASALSARRYDAAGSVVIDVVDEFRPAAGGRFALTVGAEGIGACEPTSSDPDITLPVADLGAAYLGHHRVRSIAAAGRIVEQRPGALAELDRMMHWPVGCRNFTNF